MLKASVSFNREKADARRNGYVSFRRDLGDAGSQNAFSDVNFTVMGSVFMPLTNVPCGPRETAISHDHN
jgi:hypothetical protein